MALEYVGGRAVGYSGTTSTITVDLSTLTLFDGIASHPSDGDLVIVWCFVAGTTSAPNVGSAVDIATAVYNGGGSNDVAAALEYDWYNSASPTFTLSGGTGDTGKAMAWMFQVFRGVDTTTPFQLGALSNASTDPASVTPTYAGAMIAFAAGAPTSTAFTDPGGVSNFRAVAVSETITSCSVAGAIYTGWTSGAYDPPAFGGGLASGVAGRIVIIPAQVVSGSGNVTLAAASLAATGSVTVGGSLAATLADAAISAAGAARIAGVAAATLADAGASGAGAVPITGAASLTLSAATLEASAHVVGNSLNVTLADAALSAAGVVPVAGAASLTVESAGLIATADAPQPEAALSVTLADASLSASGTIALAGNLSVTLDDATLAAAGGNYIAAITPPGRRLVLAPSRRAGRTLALATSRRSGRIASPTVSRRSGRTLQLAG